MSKLPSLTGADVVRVLKRAGFEVVRVKGSHHRLVHSDDPSRATTVSVHAGRDVPKGTLRDIIDTDAFVASQSPRSALRGSGGWSHCSRATGRMRMPAAPK